MNGLADHGDLLAADARRMSESAERLRALAARLRAAGDVPDWVFNAVHDHITACVVASGELAEAADRLRGLATARAARTARTGGTGTDEHGRIAGNTP